jgi:CRP-like cAMP-binding protein
MISLDTSARRQNWLLATLPIGEQQRLYPLLERMALPMGEVLHESGGCLQFAYFPIDSIISLIYVTKDGASAEIAVIGNDGMVGIALFMGGETTSSRAVVQSAGEAFALAARTFRDDQAARPVVRCLLQRLNGRRTAQVAVDQG